MKKHLLALAALAALASTPAFAATIVQTKTINLAATGTSTPLSFLQFDPKLGTLDSVTLAFDVNMSGASGGGVSGTVFNNSSAAKTYTLTFGSDAGLSGNGFDLGATLDSGSEVVKVAAKTKSAYGMTPVGPFSGSGTDSETLTSGLSAFEGVGDIVFDFTRTSLFSVNMNGSLSINPMIGGDATLTYNYAPPVLAPTRAPVGGVPEPATWAMLLFGFFGLGAMLRSRKQDRLAAVEA